MPRVLHPVAGVHHPVAGVHHLVAGVHQPVAGVLHSVGDTLYPVPGVLCPVAEAFRPVLTLTPFSLPPCTHESRNICNKHSFTTFMTSRICSAVSSLTKQTQTLWEAPSVFKTPGYCHGLVSLQNLDISVLKAADYFTAHLVNKDTHSRNIHSKEMQYCSIFYVCA